MSRAVGAFALLFTLMDIDGVTALKSLQHDSRQSRSRLPSLLLSTEQWTSSLAEDGRVDDIFTDFKNAFDSVSHKRLICNLSEIGIRGKLLAWAAEFLTGRSRTVFVDASKSSPYSGLRVTTASTSRDATPSCLLTMLNYGEPF
ncbi:hypothetical protein SprV_0702456100 [Sparganum proliferum]